jgi:hypothetical protein
MKATFWSLGLALLMIEAASGQTGWLPEPPQQPAPWIAPPETPTHVLSAVVALFAQGFPDPRGCEYRAMEIEVTRVPDHERYGWHWATPPPDPAVPPASAVRVWTRGWVLPAAEGTERRYAIAWNGLIYPVLGLGAPADLHAEAKALPASGGWAWPGFLSESHAVNPTNASSTRVPLLLRAGEAEAALKYRLGVNLDSSAPLALSARPVATGDVYLELAGDWARAWFARALGAHMRRDHATALTAARTLTDLAPKLEAEAARRGLPRPRGSGMGDGNQPRLYLNFLAPLPALLADLERRGREGPRVCVLDTGLTNLPTPAARVAALIRDLDLAQGRLGDDFEFVTLVRDPLVLALIAEGDVAVEPLLDCLERDTRLTCAANLAYPGLRGPLVQPVTNAALIALRGILQANLRDAAELRAYWAKYGRLPLEDRWLAILREDNPGPGRWLEAASLITATNAAGVRRGERLRTRTGPSITELLTTRALVISPTNPAGYDFPTACEFALRLAEWEPAAALPVARTLTARCRVLLEYSDTGRYQQPLLLGPRLAQLMRVRVEHGDAGAFADYAACLRLVTPAQLGPYVHETSEPLRRWATNVVLRSAAEDLFSDTASGWNHLPRMFSGMHGPPETDWLQVPAFRRLLARELDQRAACGEVDWRTPSTPSVQITNLTRLHCGLTLPLPATELPEAGSKTELRWCDWIALSLVNAKQIPPFNPGAPLPERDAVIARARAQLLQP